MPCLSQDGRIVGFSVLDGPTIDLLMVDPDHHRALGRPVGPRKPSGGPAGVQDRAGRRWFQHNPNGADAIAAATKAADAARERTTQYLPAARPAQLREQVAAGPTAARRGRTGWPCSPRGRWTSTRPGRCA